MDSGNWRVKRDPTDSPSANSNRGSPFSQRRKDGYGRGGYENRSSPRFDQNRSREGANGFIKPLNDDKAERAIEEGRRLYVGNLPYEATVQDIENLFSDLADQIEAVNMSVDPMTGRNPSYCFVDFTSRDLAEDVMARYDGQDFMRRPLKVKPGFKSGRGNVAFDARSAPQSEARAVPQPGNGKYAFDRWRRTDKPEETNKATEEGRRVYVGGLPRFASQEETNEQILGFFSGFNVEVVSKLVSPKEGNPDRSHFCFVDFSTRLEADHAIKEMNGLMPWGEPLKVSHAKGSPSKLGERRRLFVGGLPEFSSTEDLEAAIKGLFDGYRISTISKLFPPKEPIDDREGNHCFCFVELADQDQTDKAILDLDWTEAFDGKVRVKPSFSGNNKAGMKENRAPRGWGAK